MTRHTTFRYALRLGDEEAGVRRHAGASRWAYNTLLGIVKVALEAKADGADSRVPWSGFDLINTVNAYKRSPEAGVDEDGNPGLVWRHEVSQQVFEEAAVDLGRGLKAFRDSKRGMREGRRVGFPRFKKKGRSPDSFRLRNKTGRPRDTPKDRT